MIIAGPRAVQRVFEICGLTEILSFADHPPGSNVTKLRHDGDATSGGSNR